MAMEDICLGFWNWDIKTGKFIYNERFADLVGLKSGSLESDTNEFFDRLHPDDKTLLLSSILTKLNQEKVQFVGNYRIARVTGRWHWVQLRTSVFTEKNGNPLCVFGILKDIDMDKQVTDNLGALHKSQEMILHHAEEGILGMNHLGLVTLANPAAERMLGWAASDLIGSSLHYKIHHRQLEGSVYSVNDCPICMVSTDSQVHHKITEVFWRKDRTSFPVEYTSIPILNDQSELSGTVVVFRDISTQIESEKERQYLELQLRQAQKMETIGQLTGGIAHDFNNILCSMLGFTYLAKSQVNTSTSENLFEYLNEIETAGEKARDLISKLTVFSHSAKRYPENTQIMDIVDESIRLLRPTIPSSIAVNTYYEPGIENVSVYVDPMQIQQVVMNLCINARDALEDGGEISVELKINQENSQVCSSCQSKLEGEFLELIVRDDGCGVPDDQIEFIFDHYFTTKEVGKGTGMGLAVVHSLVHESKGHICLESMEGEGCTFRVCFADFQKENHSSFQNELKQKLENPISLEHAHIMVVDDDEAIGRFLKEYLSNYGYEVSCYGNGEAALKAFQREMHSFDLIVTDQTMPNLTGVELSREILALNPDLPIILCSGCIDQNHQTDILNNGIRRLLNKPVDLGELTAEINRILAERVID